MAKEKSSSVEVVPLLEFLSQLGQAYLACGEQTAIVEIILRGSATAYGVEKSKVIAFPTALFLSLHDGEKEHITLAEGPTKNLRLDQIAEVYKIGDAAERGEVDPDEGLKSLTTILKKPARFGVAGAVVGHIILSVGLAMVLTTTLPNLAAAALLGAIVGALKSFHRGQPVLSIPLPVVAAGVVSTLVFLAIKWEYKIDPLYVLIPPLVTFLPGARLTLGMVELAFGDMVSGSSRLITGFVQLLLLVIGLVAGAVIVGYTAADLVDAAKTTLEEQEFWWVGWLGVSVFGLGVYLHFSAPPGSLPWMLLVMLVAFATQYYTADLVGTTASGFFGMMVVTPLSYLIQFRFRGPPAMVTFLPSFWILVPGALSLVSVKTMLSDREAGIDGMVTALFAIVSIALGTLIGASLYKWVSDTLGWWQLQLGQVSQNLWQKSKRP
ncbi:threonine/serine exporter family protein [Bythopirellula polymerisocia]|uniref:Threonine/serine exporter-like N-terminal domain-containing protein n=1 Tax=Bythopirellula polymerisocia TaxID=2528003 RepID=A0A5C6D1U9_9BACT|nr:threonine/serine exporter family protein [Bythopirellula polymerisocia]TWU29741.1 hypothetical protein Pla144_05200 [Bythopirellula polymerisocia]